MWAEVLRQLSDILDRRLKRQVILATTASVVLAVMDMVAIALVLPLVTLSTGAQDQSKIASVVVDVFGHRDVETLSILLTVVVVSLFVLKDLGAVVFTWWLADFKAVNQARFSSDMLRHFLTMPYTQVARRSSSEMIRTMVDAVAQVFGSVVFGLVAMVSNVVAILAVLCALIISAPGPALAVAAYFGGVALVYLKIIKPKAAAAGASATEAAEGAWRTAFAALGGVKELTLRGTQEHFVRAYEAEAMRGAHAVRRREILGSAPRYLLEILFILGIGVLLLTNAIATGSGSAPETVGLTALFVAGGFRILPSITGLIGNINSVRFGASFLAVVHAERLATPKSPHSADRPTAKMPFRSEIRVEDVSFRYPDAEEAALNSVSLEIPHGSSLALVGSSGAGKTTLLDVILGLHEPSSGRVAVDGRDIRQDSRGWRASIAYVPQDVYLLDATLAENIAFDQEPEEIDTTRLARAIAQAQLEELVADLPAGVNTPVGEKGSRLSGGQRQRVGIARALYREPDLLVLDEATSALDNETEHRIAETVRALHGSITVLVVAHRLSTVRRLDQIAFMKGGRVVCVGSFDEVRRMNPEFDHLVKLGSLDPLHHVASP